MMSLKWASEFMIGLKCGLIGHRMVWSSFDSGIMVGGTCQRCLHSEYWHGKEQLTPDEYGLYTHQEGYLGGMKAWKT